MPNPRFLKILTRGYILLILFCCSKEKESNADLELLTNSKVKGIRYYKDHAFKLTYIQGEVFLIQFGKYKEGTNNFDAGFNTYELSNVADTIVLTHLSLNRPQMKFFFKNGKIKELQRFYGSNRADIWYFDYTPAAINVMLQYKDGDSLQNLELGEYQVNDSGNVTRLSKYKYDSTANSGDPSLYEVENFTYDSLNNPWQGFEWFIFELQELPDSKYFNSNNVLTKMTESNLETYEYNLNNDGLTSKAILPNGEVEYYSYKGIPFWPWDDK